MTTLGAPEPGALPSRWVRVRIGVGAAALLALFAIVGYRAWKLQTVESPRLREMAEQQYLKQIEIPPRRGTIYDRHGIPLAVSVDVDSVYANPRMVGERAAEVARSLGAVLELDPWAIQQQLSTRRYFVWVKRRIPAAQAKLVRELKIKGVFLARESRRFYPSGGLGASVVGFSGLDARGLEGVELAYDDWLRGTSLRIAGLRDALGRSVLSEGAQPVEGANHDLTLSLDKFIQFETQLALKAALPGVIPETGWIAAVVMDPRTGDVLAMASVPSFDPNHYGRSTPAEWRNRAVADAFEPGSTMKIFSIGAALELGLVKPDEVFDCEKGKWRVGHYTIRDSHPHDKLSVAGILKKSSNIGASKIGFLLGKPRLYQVYRRAGFGEQTGIHLRGARAGVLRPPTRWSDVGLANLAFGQGLTTTVLHLAQALGAIANGGVMMRPRLVLAAKNDRGEAVKGFAPRGERIISRGNAELMLQLMQGVVEPGGTGVEAALERYTVAGKTGTAQKVDPVTRLYSTDRWVSSFIAAVPATRPRLVIAVVVNDPEGDKHYGGEVAGPIFKRIAERSLGYLGVKPDRPPRAPKGEPRPALASGTSTEGYLDDDPAPPLPGEGGPHGEILVPDFTGLSIVEVLTAARKADLKLQLDGSGRAVVQSPGPGPAPRDTTCRVSFRPPS
jgi:cell division protein FtsI (penicillin-binding protein 3)